MYGGRRLGRDQSREMRAFHQLVFDGFVNGTQDVFTGAEHNSQLGLVDKLCIGGYAAQVTGTTPTLTIQVEQSTDQLHWTNRNTTPEVNAVSVSTSAATPEPAFSGQDGDPATRATLAFARLRIRLAGTTPNGQLRIWVTGRDHAGGGQ